MSSNFNNKLMSLLSDSSLYQALEMENFEKLKELQINNETKARQKYFIEKIRELFNKKTDHMQSEDQINQLIAKCNESLKDLVVGTNDFSLGTDIAFGASSIVYRGYFKYLEVAIKKVAMNTMYNKQLVS